MDPERVEAALLAAKKLSSQQQQQQQQPDPDLSTLSSPTGENGSGPKEGGEKAVEEEGGGGGNGGGDEPEAAAAAAASPETPPETVEFKVIFNKKKYDVTFALDSDVGALKAHLQQIIEIPPAMMKVMIKGLAKDEMTLRKLGVSKGSKIMVVGSSIKDVLTVTSGPSKQDLKEEEDSGKASSSSAASTTTAIGKVHKKVLDKGKPEDAMPAVKGGKKEALPTAPISGMLNKHGGKVRLTFKMEQDQVWIGTKERTEKVPMSSIKNVVSEPIEGFPEYHMLALQLGPTPASQYWVYWVPAQYVESIKDAILGKWSSW